jgi:hypothetical protein
MLSDWKQKYTGDSYKRIICDYEAVIFPCVNCWDWYIKNTKIGGSANSFKEAEKAVLDWIYNN